MKKDALQNIQLTEEELEKINKEKRDRQLKNSMFRFKLKQMVEGVVEMQAQHEERRRREAEKKAEKERKQQEIKEQMQKNIMKQMKKIMMKKRMQSMLNLNRSSTNVLANDNADNQSSKSVSKFKIIK
jgi:hypothetical protein